MLLLHAAISSPNTIALDADVIPRKVVPALHAYAPGLRDLSQSLLAQTSVGAVSGRRAVPTAMDHAMPMVRGARSASENSNDATPSLRHIEFSEMSDLTSDV